MDGEQLILQNNLQNQVNNPGLIGSQPFEILGERSRARTYDPLIKSQLLYQLSYAPA